MSQLLGDLGPRVRLPKLHLADGGLGDSNLLAQRTLGKVSAETRLADRVEGGGCHSGLALSACGLQGSIPPVYSNVNRRVTAAGFPRRKLPFMSFGSRFKEAREEMSLSQDRLGARLGVSKTTISAWERGEKLPEAARHPEIRKALRKSLDWLYGLEPSAAKAPESNTIVAEERGHYPTNDDLKLMALIAKLSNRKQQALFDLLADDEDI